MKYILSLICVFSLIIITDGQTQSCLQNQDHIGYQTLSQSTSSGTIEREYILYVPEEYDSTNSLPLIINLHGFGDCASDFEELIGGFFKFNELADKENILVAYPQGAYRPDKDDNYWEPGDNGLEDIYENDVYFIEQLVADLDNQYNLDLSQVYAIGYSNGGMMAYSLACNSSDLFAAIGIMSGTMLEEDCSIDNPVPVIKFHGIADEVLPYNGNLWYQSVADVIQFWLAQNDISDDSKVSTDLNDGKVIREEYTADDNSSCLRLYTVLEEYDKPGDHVWFSDLINDNTPNEIIWDFFSKSCGGVTSVGEVSGSKTDFDLVINQSTHTLTISSEELINAPISIYNVQGYLCQSTMAKSQTFSLDIHSLSPGIYFLQLNGISRKFIITQ